MITHFTTDRHNIRKSCERKEAIGSSTNGIYSQSSYRSLHPGLWADGSGAIPSAKPTEVVADDGSTSIPGAAAVMTED